MTGCLLIACPVFLCSTPKTRLSGYCHLCTCSEAKLIRKLTMIFFIFLIAFAILIIQVMLRPTHLLLSQYFPTIPNDSKTFNVLSLSLSLSVSLFLSSLMKKKLKARVATRTKMKSWVLTKMKQKITFNYVDINPPAEEISFLTNWSEHLYWTVDIDKTHEGVWER